MLSSLWKRSGIGEAISQLTDASSIKFVEELPDSRIDHLMLMIRQAESKEEITALEKEVDFLRSPAQVCMRHHEQMAHDDLSKQMSSSSNRIKASKAQAIRDLAKSAYSSWRTISGADLTFVPTQSPMKENTRQTQAAQVVESMVDVSKLTFAQCIEQVHLSLARGEASRAALCALHMIELVGESDGSDDTVTIEVADACSRKVAKDVLEMMKEYAKLADQGGRGDWEHAFRKGVALGEIVAPLGAGEDACVVVAAYPRYHPPEGLIGGGGAGGVEEETRLLRARLDEMQEFWGDLKGWSNVRRTMCGWACGACADILGVWADVPGIKAVLDGGEGGVDDVEELGGVLQAVSELEETCGDDFVNEGGLADMTTLVFEALDRVTAEVEGGA